MKLTLAATLLGAFLSAPFAHGTHNSDELDIVDTAAGAGSFDTLVAAVRKAKLVEALKGDGPFTVFAPSDDAFGKLPQGTLEALLEKGNRARLASILTYHVVPGLLTARDVADRNQATTLNGQRLDFDNTDGAVLVDGARVVKTDIQCKNGIIHVIDSVMLPSEQDLAATAKSAGTFGTLLAAADAAGLVPALTGDGPLTVFAPTDEAFRKLPKGTLAQLLEPENKSRLKSILSYHVVPGRLFADEALEKGAAQSLQESKLSFALKGGRFTVSGANVTANDIDAANGVVHVIDRVLLPPEAPATQGRKVIGVYLGDVSSGLAAQLGIDKKKTVLVSSLVKNGNAASAGLEQYDVITAINGRPATKKSLAEAKEESGFGGKVRLDVLRKGKRLHIDVPVGVDRH